MVGNVLDNNNRTILTTQPPDHSKSFDMNSYLIELRSLSVVGWCDLEAFKPLAFLFCH